MTFHALAVDDSPAILEDLKDRLECLGHTCDCVTCVHLAREHLVGSGYSYILLDLEIPVRYGRPSRISNGQSLLREIRSLKGYEDIPIIVITSHGQNSPDLAVEVLRGNGAIDFVRKPFPDIGNTLEKAIVDALATSGRLRTGATTRSRVMKKDKPQPFESGEMVFFDSHVELCEVKICGDGENHMIRSILDVLRQTNSHGRYVRCDGTELARIVGCDRGQSGVAQVVCEFRKHVCEVMLEQANIKMNRMYDIIVNDRRYGYRLSSKITVRDADAPEDTPADEPVDASVDIPHDEHCVPANEPVNEVVGVKDGHEKGNRQQWILAQMKSGVAIRKADVIGQFKCSEATAVRDLRNLRSRGLIEFVGQPRSGYWKVKG